jgi:hypothetical protein
MSSSANARSVAENSRRPSTTTGAKIRAPSSRVNAKERPLSSGEVIPEDSASNAPHRRSASGTSKPNGGIGRGFGGSQTERIHLATRDNLQVRTRSPVKLSKGDDVEEGVPADVPSRQDSRAADRPARNPRKEKEVLRELLRSLRG